ncbi:MAG: SH3 domain-containing protein [Acidobacteria bacterium]|nr:SH3 domain-containing protein [Acidobacteriota bacterium]
MWVSAPQANLRDKLVTLYNKTGLLHNAEKVEVLEKQKRFVRIRSAAGVEGWVEQRYLVGADVFEGFQKLAVGAAGLPGEGHAATRASLNMHLTPVRDAAVLYQLKEGDKVEILKRAVAEKSQPGTRRPAGVPAPVKTAAGAGAKLTPAAATLRSGLPERQPAGSPPPVLEDWWLVRDSGGHAGWVLGRMLDLEVPLEIAQYAEGQRIVGCFPLNEVADGDKKIPQYLTLITEPHDGQPWDFDQVRVFTWNLKRHRYETGYRERKLSGMLPVKVGTQDFGKEGILPTFTIHTQDEDGQGSDRTYRLVGPIVRRVVAGTQPAESAAPAARSPRRRRR